LTGVLVLSQNEREAIAYAIERARSHPIPWEVLAPQALADVGPYFQLKDRKPGARPQTEMVLLPVGYQLAISFEHQPAGLCLHISMSSPDPASNVPNQHAMALVAEACGMQWPAGDRSRLWLEEIIDGPKVGKAVNLIEVVELAA
jgi:hypothetical protein